VLQTTFTTAHGVVQVSDAMALPSRDLGPTRALIRRVDRLAGHVPTRWIATLLAHIAQGAIVGDSPRSRDDLQLP
jgi:hypothetical protein